MWHLAPTGPLFSLENFYQSFLEANLSTYRRHVEERAIAVIGRNDHVPTDLTDTTYYDMTTDCTDPHRAHEQAMSRWVTKRTLRKIDITFGNGNGANQLRFSTKAYALLRPATIPSSKKIDGRTSKAVNTETQHVCSSTGAVLEKHQIATHYKFGKNDRALITTSEVETIKRTKVPPTVRILGFKPSHYVLPMHQSKNPTFLYPDDERLQGSTGALVTLHRRMLLKHVVAICGVKIHIRSPERLGALVPQKEVVNSEDARQQAEPPGLLNFFFFFLFFFLFFFTSNFTLRFIDVF